MSLSIEQINQIKQQFFQHFRCPYKTSNYKGKVFLYENKRIKIIEKFEQIDIEMIIFDGDEQVVYLVEKSLAKLKLDRDDFKNSSKNFQEYFNKWKGYRYVKGKQLYYGHFKYFSRDNLQVTEQSHQLTLEKVDVDLPSFRTFKKQGHEELISYYRGYFVNDTRDSHNNENSTIELYNPQNAKQLLMTMSGKYKSDIRQHEYSYCLAKQNQLNTVYYFNGCLKKTINQNERKLLQNKLNIKLIQIPSHFAITFTQKTIKSLSDNNWLNTQAVDYFFRRLQFSYHSLPLTNKKHHLKIFPISFFEKCMPSMIISNMSQNINYKSVEYYFKPFRNIVSIFEVYKLILFPINRDTSHFTLAAVQTTITRKKDHSNQIQNISIKIYVLDSIYNDNIIQQRIVSLIHQIIKQQIPSQQKYKYFQALQAAKNKIQTSTTLKITRQTNGNDCGLFVCLFGFLLYRNVLKIEQNSNKQIIWQFKNETLKKIRQLLKNCILYHHGNFIQRLMAILKKDKLLYDKEVYILQCKHLKQIQNEKQENNQ